MAPRFVRAAEVSRVCNESVLVAKFVVNLLQSKGGKIGEHVDEYFVGNPEYCEAVVRSKTC